MVRGTCPTIVAIVKYRNFTESCNTLKPNHVLIIAQLCLRRCLRKTRGKYVRAESKSKLAAQSPIISLPNKLNTHFIHSSLHKQARDNSKVTLVIQFSIFNSVARFQKISVSFSLIATAKLYLSHCRVLFGSECLSNGGHKISL